MPYNNAYNQDIANTVERMNQRYINHLSDESEMMLGSGNSASKCECIGDPLRGLGMCGGSGYGSATVRDDGYERTIGAGVGSKVYKKVGAGQIASMPPSENLNEYPQNFVMGKVGGMMPMERPVGGRKKGRGVKELTDDLKKFDMNRIKDYVGLAKPKKGRGLKELTDDLKKADLNRVKDYVGLGMPVSPVKLARMPKKNLEKVVEKSQMQGVVGGGRSGGGVSGGADKRKARANLVRKVMAEKGLKMIEASSYIKKHGLSY